MYINSEPDANATNADAVDDAPPLTIPIFVIGEST